MSMNFWRAATGKKKYAVDSFYALVENIGVEPMTSCVQGRRSSQLS